MKKLSLAIFTCVALTALLTFRVQSEEKSSPGNQPDPAQSNRAGHLLIQPPTIDSDKVYPLFIFIHGLGDSPRSFAESSYDLITQQPFYILIPEGPLPYDGGFSWYRLTDLETFQSDAQVAESLVKGLIGKVIRSYPIDRNKIYLSGFSQGGRLSFYIGIRNPAIFSSILPIGGVYMDNLLDADLKDAKDLKIEIFHGTKDDVNSFLSIQEAYNKLRALGMNVSLTTYPLGHTYDEATLEEVLNRVGKD